MKEVAAIFDLELDEWFKIKDYMGKYKFTEEGLRCDTIDITDNLFVLLLTGACEIEKKPFEPKEGDTFVYITMSGYLERRTFHEYDDFSALLLNMGNYFSDESTATDHIGEMLIKYEEMRRR